MDYRKDMMFVIWFEIDGVECNTLAHSSNEEAEAALETLEAVDAVETPEIQPID